MNSVHLCGRLGADPETRSFANGGMKCHLRLAVTRWVPGRDGKNGEERTEWFGVDVFNKQAEFCAQDLRKGALVTVAGRLTDEEWTAQDGTQKKRTGIRATKVYYVRPGQGSYQRPPQQQQGHQGGGYQQRPPQQQQGHQGYGGGQGYGQQPPPGPQGPPPNDDMPF